MSGKNAASGSYSQRTQTPQKPFSDDWFWDRISPEPNSGCWLWCGLTKPNGYGRGRSGSRDEYMHRWSYQRFVGPVPEQKFVLHRCDVKCCVNPDHLFVGTHIDNVQDAVSKRRYAHSERNGGGGRLLINDVLAIRSSSEKGSILADKYGVSDAIISLIRNRKRWLYAD